MTIFSAKSTSASTVRRAANAATTARNDHPAAQHDRPLVGRDADDSAHPPHRRRPLGDRRLQGRRPDHPGWYKNLEANPEATIEVRDEEIPVRASTAEGEERERLWRLMTEAWPAYDEYQQKTDREIPVVVLSRR